MKRSFFERVMGWLTGARKPSGRRARLTDALNSASATSWDWDEVQGKWRENR